jgi:hypothetical protein
MSCCPCITPSFLGAAGFFVLGMLGGGLTVFIILELEELKKKGEKHE